MKVRNFRVAVVTPYADEPLEWLNAMQQSVASQTYACTHIMVADGPRPQPSLPCKWIQLPTKVGDFGDTPRCVGSFYAAGLGFDAIAYLDADNGFDPDHIERAVTLHFQTGASVITSRRRFVSLDGLQMAECLTSDGEQFCDTNCLILTRPAFDVLGVWALMNPKFHAIDDRVLWHALCNGGYKRAHTGLPTVAYRATHASIYTDLGKDLPGQLKPKKARQVADALAAWDAAGHPSVRHVWQYRRLAPQLDPVLKPSDAAAVEAVDPTITAVDVANQPIQVAVRYHPDAYDLTTDRVMGRHVAGATFLKALLADNRHFKVSAQGVLEGHRASFERLSRQHATEAQPAWVDATDTQALQAIGVLHHADPDLLDSAWIRAQVDQRGWSITGVAHTATSLAATRVIEDMLTAPLHPWDALICTSQAAQTHIQGIFDQRRAYLLDRFGGKPVAGPQIRLIPLGIHTSDFIASTEKRHAARSRWAIGERDRVVLYLGRIAFHAKAHPLPMYVALQQAALALEPDQRLVLLECGWHAHPAQADWYRQLALHTAPHICIVQVDGRQPELKAAALAAADVFCSLADNIQETFGITPLEAMAAGLPVVVSDWNGYRDTVRHGIDGYRISTTMPPPGAGLDLARAHVAGCESYDAYIGKVSSLVGVDIQQTAHALSTLVRNPDIAVSMGQAGQSRARHTFDWATTLAQYRSLWAELTRIRQHAASQPHPAVRPPQVGRSALQDPFQTFRHYATRSLDRSSLVRRTEKDAEAAAAQLRQALQQPMLHWSARALPKTEALVHVLSSIPPSLVSIEDLNHWNKGLGLKALFRSVAWLHKLGFLQVIGKV